MTTPSNDTRTSALIAMAQAISNRSRRPQHWMDYLPEAIAALDALNAALPGLGIKMVPLVATPDMNISGSVAWCEALPASETYVDCAYACYVAMIEAAPKFGGSDG